MCRSDAWSQDSAAFASKHGMLCGRRCSAFSCVQGPTASSMQGLMHDGPCRAALASTQVLEPRIPVISNVDAQPHSDPETIKDILARQVPNSAKALHDAALCSCMCAPSTSSG